MKPDKFIVPEKDIQRSILNYLNSAGHFAWRNNTGATVAESRGKKRFFRYGLKGSSDILVCLKGGKFGAIEVKRKGKLASQDQTEFLNAIQARGGFSMVAYSVDDVIIALQGVKL